VRLKNVGQQLIEIWRLHREESGKGGWGLLLEVVRRSFQEDAEFLLIDRLFVRFFR
jgi:hypothetical protein